MNTKGWVECNVRDIVGLKSLAEAYSRERVEDDDTIIGKQAVKIIKENPSQTYTIANGYNTHVYSEPCVHISLPAEGTLRLLLEVK